MLSVNLRGKQALAILARRQSRVGVDAHGLFPSVAFDQTLITGNVSDTGKITAHVSISSRGDNEMFLRFAMRRMPSNRWKDIFDYMMGQPECAASKLLEPQGQRSQRHRLSDCCRL